jgi:hypothetical protein
MEMYVLELDMRKLLLDKELIDVTSEGIVCLFDTHIRGVVHNTKHNIDEMTDNDLHLAWVCTLLFKLLNFTEKLRKCV